MGIAAQTTAVERGQDVAAATEPGIVQSRVCLVAVEVERAALWLLVVTASALTLSVTQSFHQ